MLVLVDNIEVQIEKIYEVFDLIDNEGADLFYGQYLIVLSSY
nr:hypothetical protein [Rickettsia honei]